MKKRILASLVCLSIMLVASFADAATWYSGTVQRIGRGSDGLLWMTLTNVTDFTTGASVGGTLEGVVDEVNNNTNRVNEMLAMTLTAQSLSTPILIRADLNAISGAYAAIYAMQLVSPTN